MCATSKLWMMSQLRMLYLYLDQNWQILLIHFYKVIMKQNAHTGVCSNSKQAIQWVKMTCDLSCSYIWVGYGLFTLSGTIIHVAPHIQYILWLSVSIVKNDRNISLVSLNNPHPSLPSLSLSAPLLLSVPFLLHFSHLSRRMRTSSCHWDVILWGSIKQSILYQVRNLCAHLFVQV